MGQKFCNKGQKMKIDKIRWTEAKVLLKENYRTQKEVAELLGLGRSTVQRINSTGSFHEYRAVSKAQHKVVTDSKSKRKFWKKIWHTE